MHVLNGPIPVSVVTGFLGAGKSTLLNRLLKEPVLFDAAVIINEFGEVGIDHLLVEASADTIIELSNGCLCCTVRGELIETLAELLDAIQTGRAKPVSRVIIETTGVADPVPVLQAIIAHPAIAASFRVDGVITLVDALAGEKTLADHREAVRQVAVADRLVLTKTDIATSEDTNRLRAALAGINPLAELVEAGDIRAASPDILSAGFFDLSAKPEAVGSWMKAATSDHHHHRHDVNRHDEHICAFALSAEKPLPRGTVDAFQNRLAADYGAHILRLKGVVAVVGDRYPRVVHGVRDMIYPASQLANWPAGTEGKTRIVVITRDLAEEPVREMFQAFINTPGIDRPDRAALEDNPLSAFGFKP